MEQFISTLPEGKSVTCLEDLGSFSVKELKNVLVSYREKSSGAKADLVLRVYALFCKVNDTMNSSTAFSSDGTSPDLSSDAWTYQFFYNKFCLYLPWTSDLRGIPPFNFIQLYEYLVIRTKKFKHIWLKSTAYKKLKSFNFFYEGFIRKIQVAREQSFTYFDVRIKASMKRTLYKIFLKLSNSSGDVLSAACTCPAGIGLGGFGNCNHVGAVLFALEDFNRKGLQKFPEPVSCTSMLSSWNVPSASQIVNPKPIDEVLIRKIKFGRDNKSQVPKYNIYDPRAPADQQVNEDRVADLTSKLSSLIPDSCYFGFHDKESIAYTLSQPTSPSRQNFDFFESHCAFSDFYDISTSSFKEMMDIYCQNLSVTLEEVCAIEQSTYGQCHSEKWMEERKYRITASNFYSAAVNTVEPSSKLKSMFYSSFHSASTNHGNKYEGHVRDLYCAALHEQGYNVKIEEVGLKVSQSCPYLGASLDGMVFFDGEVWGLEIKCPFSKYNSNLEEALLDKKFFLKRDKGEVKLKRSHKYYYQVQGQMFCADVMRTDFVVWFGDEEPLFVETIFYDEHFTSKFVLPQLKFFYCRAVLPEFFTRRVERGLLLYLQGGWENFEKGKAK